MCQTKHNISSQVAGGAGVEHASTNEDNAVRFMKNSIAIIASAFPLRPLFYWYWCILGQVYIEVVLIQWLEERQWNPYIDL